MAGDPTVGGASTALDVLGAITRIGSSSLPGTVISAEELRDYVKGQVAAYKYPRQVWIVDALPKGATGKIQKRDIVIPAGLAAP